MRFRYMIPGKTFVTGLHVRLSKTETSLCIRAVWFESSQDTPWVSKDPKRLQMDSELMRRLIWVSAKGTCYLSSYLSIYRSIDLRPSVCLKWRPPSLVASRKHAYIILTPFSKTGIYRGIHILLISPQKHRLRVPVRTVSSRWFKRVPAIYVLSRNMKKNIRIFYLKIFICWW